MREIENGNGFEIKASERAGMKVNYKKANTSA